MSKASLRRKMKARVAGVERVAESTAIRALLAPGLPAAGLVLAFEPLADEPDIGEIIERLRDEKRLALVTGGRTTPVIAPATPLPVLALVPGRAFDRRGYRLGRGGGTFDRLLVGLSCPKIGVAFSCQLVDELPVEAHDVRMDEVVTGAGRLVCGR